MRAWIEMQIVIVYDNPVIVALFMRAWIEIRTHKRRENVAQCRPLHEGVD